MKIVISGASGLVGSAIVPLLATRGHEVMRLVRKEPAVFDTASLEGAGAVIHLAGENIAGARWSRAVKRRIRESRVSGTRFLAGALAGMKPPPGVLVCASAIGFYGDRGDERLTEASAPGRGFLADVCREWEAAAAPAAAAGIRVVNLRFGMILSPAGGALAKMLTPFRLGLGGRLGPGRQYMSWIGIDDAVSVIHHAIEHPGLAGPVNAVSPEPVTNREFTKTMGRVLRRPTIFPMPGFAARLVFGEMADALLLASARVFPVKLSESGHRFLTPGLESTLRRLLGRDAADRLS